jgi:hypothetical protein
LHPWASETGGLISHDSDGSMASAIKEVSKKIAANAVRGKLADMVSVPAPAYIHHYTSHHNLQQNDVTQCRFLSDAYKQSDPIERLKYIVAFYISGQYISSSVTKAKVPLNPILGETLQREMATGEKLYCEQISHHPPITAWLLEGPDQVYQMWGYHSLKAWLNGLQSVGGSKDGKC